MSLKKCLKKLGLEKYEETIIRSEARELTQEGADSKAAAIQAVQNRLDVYKKERESIVSQIRDKDGVLPEKQTLFQEAQVNTDPRILYQSAQERNQIFYSQLESHLTDKLPGSGTPAQIKQMIEAFAKKGQIKKEELEWSGVLEWLDSQKGKIKKQDVIDFLQANQVQVEEVIKGGGVSEEKTIAEVKELINDGVDITITDQQTGEKIAHSEVDHFYDDNDVVNVIKDSQIETKFATYQLPGGENYRELLLTLPKQALFTVRREKTGEVIESFETSAAADFKLDALGRAGYYMRTDNSAKPFRNSHYDEPNILAHIRFNERTDADGKRVLFIEEIQSDWHQKGRKEGYQKTEGKAYVREGNYGGYRFGLFMNGEQVDAFHTRAEAENALPTALEASITGVPDAPFKRTMTKTGGGWAGLAFKRMIRYASENGFERIAWTTGEQQADRYDLSKQAELIRVYRDKKGKYRIYVRPIDSEDLSVVHTAAREDQLEGLVGKELTKKIVNQKDDEVVDYTGVDLKVGGESMKTFYDKMLPSMVNKYVKKWGAKVGEADIQVSSGRVTYPMSVYHAAEDFYKNGDSRESALSGLQKAYPTINEKSIRGALSDAYPTTVHALSINDKMRASAMAGQPLFQRASAMAGQPLFQRGKIQFMPDGSINITLLKDANLSTFLHETGHLWMEELIEDATSPNAPQQLIDDLDIILKHVGVKTRTSDGADKIRESLKTENLEKFAVTVEKYLWEGKAPSSELRRAMAAFRSWLVAVYKAIGPDAKLTNEVRGVMDRLIATDEEIANAKAEGEVSPLFSTAEEMGYSEEKFKAFRETVEDASREAQEELEQRLIKEYARERKEWWRSERQTVVETVTEQVDSMPVYKALAAIKAEDGPRMDRKTIRESIYGDALKRLPKGTTIKGGFHPDAVAGMVGYKSGQELVTALAALQPRKQLIEAEADRIMRERHGDMMTDGTLHEKAKEAVQNDLRSKVIIEEMKALKKKAREVKPFIKAEEKERKEEARAGRDIYRALVPKIADVREKAKRLIAGKSVREIKPYQYFVAARKASRAAIEAYRKGDFLLSGHQKGFELLSMEMYRESIRVKKEIDKSLTKLNKAFVSDIKQSKTKNIDMVNAARAILAAHGIGKADTNAGMYLEKIRKYDPEVYENLRDIIEPALTDQRDYRDMSAEEFFGMRDGVLSLMYNARRSKQIEIEGKMIDRDVAIDALVGRISEFGKKTKLTGYHRAQTKWEKTKIGLLDTKAVMRRVESWVSSMDGGDPDGVFRRYLWTPVVESVYKFREMNKTYLEKYLDTVKIIEETLTHDKINAPELHPEAVFNGKKELLHALLHTGNDSNKSKLLVGYGWGELNEDGTLNASRWDAFIDRMIEEGVITKADYVFAQGVWDLLEELKPMAQKAHHQMYGYYFDEVTANELDTPFGKFRGGYIPAIVDPGIVADAAIKRDKDELEHGQNSFAFPTTGRGATKTRIKTYNRQLQLDMATIPAHINWVLRFSILEPAVKDVGRIIINRDFRAAMDAMDPAAARHMLMPWLQRTARQTVATPGMLPSVDKAWRNIRRRTGMQIMVFNIVNTLQQFTGLSIAKTKLKRGSMRNAFWLYMTKNAEVTQLITDRSAMMRTRLFTQHVEVQQHIDDLLLNPTKYEKVRDFTDKHGYFLQIGTQSIVDKIVWIAAYNESIGEMTEKQAALHADSVVRETQGSFAPEDISRIESGTPFMRAFLMFYNYFNMQANLLGTEFNNIATNEMGLRKGAGRAFYIYFFGLMIPAFIGDGLIRAMMAGEPDDEGDGYIDDYIAMFFGTQIRTALAMVPAIGPIGSYAYDKMTGRSRYGDRITASPVVSVMESAVRAPHSVYKAIVEDGNQKKATKDALNALGMATGLPFGAAARPLGYLADVNQKKAKPENIMDVTRGLISGRDVNRKK